MKTIALALMASAILGFGSLALGSGPCTTDAATALAQGASSECCCTPCPGPCVPGGCCE